ncbi:MAG: hypothetical protein ACJA13_001824 [Paraglaciecola sp.]|jgi:hypothetical protein
MQYQELYAFAADAILLSHALFVVFVVSGLFLIFLGKFKAWRWVTNPWWRLTHLLSIAVVVVQSWLGIICPLTHWEMALRTKAGETAYEGSFISHWLNLLLYYQAPQWVFILCYSVFAALVLASWFWVKPRAF